MSSPALNFILIKFTRLFWVYLSHVFQLNTFVYMYVSQFAGPIYCVLCIYLVFIRYDNRLWILKTWENNDREGVG